jgi:hypothetical protein
MIIYILLGIIIVEAIIITTAVIELKGLRQELNRRHRQ